MFRCVIDYDFHLHDIDTENIFTERYFLDLEEAKAFLVEKLGAGEFEPMGIFLQGLIYRPQHKKPKFRRATIVSVTRPAV